MGEEATGGGRQGVTLCGERLNTYVSTDDCTSERRTAFRISEPGGRNFGSCMYVSLTCTRNSHRHARS